MRKDEMEVPVKKGGGWFSKAVLIGSIIVSTVMPLKAVAETPADSDAQTAGQTMLIVQNNKDMQNKVADGIMAKLSKQAQDKGVSIAQQYQFYRVTVMNLLQSAHLNPSRPMSFRIQNLDGSSITLTLNAGAVQSSFDVAMK